MYLNNCRPPCQVYKPKRQKGETAEERTEFLWGDPRKKQLERPRRRWEENIKIDLQKVGWGHEPTQDNDRGRTLVKAVINIRVP